MVNLLAMKQNKNIESTSDNCELAALLMTCADPFECLHMATVLRIEHNIPKRTLEPMEYYGFCKEWETIEELETCRGDSNKSKLQAILAKERIHQGQNEKLLQLIRKDLISAVLVASKSEAGELLRHHLNIWSRCKPDGERPSIFHILPEWKYEIEEHFDSFDTTSIVELIQIAIKNLPRCFQIFGLLPSITTLIMKLYRRNRQVGDTFKNEQIVAKELLQQLLDTEEDGEGFPLQHVITEQNFSFPEVYRVITRYTSCDYELMKMLLKSEIQVNAVDSDGNTILHAAVGCIYEGTVKQERHGCELNQETVDQWIRSIQLLLDKGVYPNAQNDKCRTARDKLGVVRHNDDESIASMDVKGRISQMLQQYELQNSRTLKHVSAVFV